MSNAAAIQRDDRAGDMTRGIADQECGERPHVIDIH